MSIAESSHEPLVPTWTLGDRLRKARVQAGLERQEMAEGLHVSLSSVAGWENGDSKPRDVAAIVRVWADLTGVDPVWLMFGEQFRCSLHSVDMPDGQMTLALGVPPRDLAVVEA